VPEAGLLGLWHSGNLPEQNRMQLEGVHELGLVPGGKLLELGFLEWGKQLGLHAKC
jgi:hypothetical protein